MGIIFIGFGIWALTYLFGNLAADLFERVSATRQGRKAAKANQEKTK